MSAGVHDEAVRVQAGQSNRTYGSRMILLLRRGRLTNTILLPLFKVVSASHAACLISRFSFGSNSLNTAEMGEKRADGRDNGADSQPASNSVCMRRAHIQKHTHRHAHNHAHVVQTCAHADVRIQETEIRVEWIMKQLLTLFTYDPLSITQMDTTLSY